MLVIRLQRIGKKHQAAFRIVLQESQWKPQGKVLELLGFYNPHSKEKQIQAERVKFWLAKGAQASATVHNMLVDAGAVTAEKVKAWRPKKGRGGTENQKSPKQSELATGQAKIKDQKLNAEEIASSHPAGAPSDKSSAAEVVL